MNLTECEHQLLTQKVLDCLIVNNIKTASAFVAHQPAILHAKCGLLTLEEIFILRDYFIQKFELFEVNLDPSNVKQLKNEIIQPLKSDYIYEIFGSPGCGKTQISMYLSAEMAKQDKKVLYIDTKNDFSITRLKSYFGQNSSEDTLVCK
jgi:DNA replication protein DnaC